MTDLDGTPLTYLDPEDDDMPFPLTFFFGLREPQGLPMVLGFDHVRAILRDPGGPVGPGLPLWSFATFTGGRRRLSSVEAVHAVGLDVDTPTDDPAGAIRDVATRTGAHVLAHSTRSCQPGAFRLRLILPYDAPADGDTHRLSWRVLARLCRGLGVVVDRACSDPSRAFFVPVVPPSGAYWWGEAEGKPWPVKAAAQRELELIAEELRHTRLPETAREYRVGASVEARAARYLDTMEPAVAGQGGHDATYRAALHLVRGFGLDTDQAFGLLWRGFNPRCSPPWSEWDLRRKCAQAAKADRVGGGWHG